MTPDERKRMSDLCELIANEKDLDKFAELVHQLDDLLAAKENRLEPKHPASE